MPSLEESETPTLGQMIPRFLLVGGIGFLVDGGILAALTLTGTLGPLAARLVSFPLAVLVTWWLNRRHTFRSEDARIVRQIGRYLATQGLGALINFSLYAVMLAAIATIEPLIAFAVASACAMTVNFLGARYLVFRAKS